MAQARVPKGMLLDGAQMSLAVLVAGAMGFLKGWKIPIEEWIGYIGKEFEDSWAGLKGEPLDRVMGHFLALEVLPLGAEVVSSQLTSQKAQVTLTALPSRTVLEKFDTTPRELLRGFGVTQREFSSLYAMFEPAAKAIGLRLTHQLKGRRQVLTLERAGRRPQRRSRKVEPRLAARP